MRNYKVMIRGENFLLNIDDSINKYGFYATRSVKASDAESAGNAAIEMLRNDPDLTTSVQNAESDAPMMFVENVEELTFFGTLKIPNKGFSFYRKEESD